MAIFAWGSRQSGITTDNSAHQERKRYLTLYEEAKHNAECTGATKDSAGAGKQCFLPFLKNGKDMHKSCSIVTVCKSSHGRFQIEISDV